jgi:thioredoxin-like negative regulator of GroEL
MQPNRLGILIFLLLGSMCLGSGLPVRAQTPPAPQAKPEILEFSRKLCPICLRSEQIIKAVQDQYPGQFRLRIYTIDQEGFPFQRYKVAIVPGQVFLDPAGQEVYRHSGVFKPEELIKKLRELKFIR